MVEEVGLKSEQTMYQKGGSPCRTVRHHPLRTLNKPLKENSKKLQEIQDCRRASRSFASYRHSCRNTIGFTSQKCKECLDMLAVVI
jgi:hypothetical protein